MSTSTTDDREARRAALFEELHRTGATEARDQLVESYQPLADFFANRFSNRGVEEADLKQVAVVGLIKAVDRFDPTLETAFSSFAGRTIEGELKRYFRDKTWTVRVPRSLKESSALVRRAVDDITAETGRSPTVDQVATHTGLSDEDVIEALEASSAYTPSSLDRPVTDGPEEPTAPLGARLGSREPGFERVTTQLAVKELLDGLDDQARSVVELTFYGEMTQTQIAEHHGISQMQVSRLLRRSLEQLRSAAEAPE